MPDDVSRAWAEGSKESNEKGNDKEGCQEQTNSNGKNDNDEFIQVKNKKSNVVYEKVLKPNYKPYTQQSKAGYQKGNLHGKGEAKFAFQPKKKVNRSVVSKESVVMPEAMNSQGNQKSHSQTPGENADVGYNNDEKELDDDTGIWNIRGLSTSNKQKEVKNFITDEALSICEVLETRIKSKMLNNIGDNIFGNWDWYSNMQHCDKGCRIMLGWNSEHVSINLVHCAKQSMFCEIHTVNGNKKVFCTFMYATNGAKERRDLWKDLQIYKRIVGNQAWIMIGDMNVTLVPNKHSVGSSCMTSDMNEFKECTTHTRWGLLNSYEDLQYQKALHGTVNRSFLEAHPQGFGWLHERCEGGSFVRQRSKIPTGDPKLPDLFTPWSWKLYHWIVQIKCALAINGDDCYVLAMTINDFVNLPSRKKVEVSVFLLPKSVIEDINKLLKGFLWNQEELSRGRSVWAVSEEVYDSWGWKNILKVRDESFISHRDIYNVRRNDNMVVKDIVDNGVYMWLEEWIAKYPDLALHHRIALNNNKEDTIVWRSKSEKIYDMYCGNSTDSIIRRLSLAACVYLIWQEMNWKIFRDDKRSLDELFGIFEDIIRMRLMSLRVKRHVAVLRAQQRWNIII
ncbi:RNA-directed DNA polymerase, eukaryota, reverse transcriptase zinc-binding domain protein [Tanacetum coccineum]